jgi:hypothetical protein
MTPIIGSDQSNDRAGKLYRNTFKGNWLCCCKFNESVSECDLIQDLGVGETAKQGYINFIMVNWNQQKGKLSSRVGGEELMVLVYLVY